MLQVPSYRLTCLCLSVFLYCFYCCYSHTFFPLFASSSLLVSIHSHGHIIPYSSSSLYLSSTYCLSNPESIYMNQDEARKGARQRLARRLLVKSMSSPSPSPLDAQVSRGARRASVVVADENRSRKSTDQEEIDRTFKGLCAPERKSAEGRLERERVRVGELVVVLTPPEETKQPSSTLFPFATCPSPTFSFRPKKRSTLRSTFTRSDSSFSISSRTRTSGSDSSSRPIQRSDSFHQQDQIVDQVDIEDAGCDFPTDDIQDGLWNISPTPFSTPSQELPSNPFGFDSTWVHTSDEASCLKELGPALNIFGIEATSHFQIEVGSDEGLEKEQIRSQYVTTPPPDAPLPTLPTSNTSPEIVSPYEAYRSEENSGTVKLESIEKLNMPNSIPKEIGPINEEFAESPERPSISVQALHDSSSLDDAKSTEIDLCIVSVENSELSPPKAKEDKKEKVSMGKTLKTFRSFTKLLKLVGADGKKSAVVKQDAPVDPVRISDASTDRIIASKEDSVAIASNSFPSSGVSNRVPIPPTLSQLFQPNSIDLAEDGYDLEQTPTKKPVSRKISLASLSNALRSSSRKKSLESMRGTRSSFSSDVPNSSVSENVPDVPPIPSWARSSEGVHDPDKLIVSRVQPQPSSEPSASTPALTSVQTTTTTQTPDLPSISYEHQALERPSFAVEAASWALAMVYTETPSPTKAAFSNTNIEDETNIEIRQNREDATEEDVQKTDQRLSESMVSQAEVDEKSDSAVEKEGANSIERGREMSVNTEVSQPDTDTDTDTGDEGFFDAEEGESEQNSDETDADENGEFNEDDPSDAIIEVLRAHPSSFVSASASTVSSVSSAPSTTSESTSSSTPAKTPHITDTVSFGSLPESLQNPSENQVAFDGSVKFGILGKTGDEIIGKGGENSLNTEGWGVRFESLNFENLELDLSF